MRPSHHYATSCETLSRLNINTASTGILCEGWIFSAEYEVLSYKMVFYFVSLVNFGIIQPAP